MTKLPISVCLIVKNEQEVLEECLQSIDPNVGEVIVVDTGSTDSTLEIAHTYATRIEQIAWQDDFSAARNHAASLAKEAWILFIDADEILTIDGFQKIRKAIANPAISAYSLIQRNYTDDHRIPGWRSNQTQAHNRIPPRARRFLGFFDNPMGRLYRNRCGITWEGVVHECILPSCVRNGLKTANLSIPLHHFGKGRGTAFLSQKDNYYLKLSLQKVKQEPESAVAWFEMGNNLAALQQHKTAESAFSKALELKPDWMEAKLHKAIMLVNLDYFSEGERLLTEVLHIDPENEDALCHLSTTYLNQGKFEACEHVLNKALTINRRLFLAHLNFGILAYEKKEFSKSRHHFEEALTISPHDPFSKAALEKIKQASTPEQCFQASTDSRNQRVGK